MDFIRNWVVSVSAAGLVFALLLGVLPAGSGRRIVKLAGGIVLTLVIFSPLAKLNPDDLHWDMGDYKQTQERRLTDMQQASEKITKEIIQEQTGAYIVNKAQALGLSIRVSVTVQKDKTGLLIPDAAIIWGGAALSKEDREQLSAWMADVLGIATRRQDWRWEE